MHDAKKSEPSPAARRIHVLTLKKKRLSHRLVLTSSGFGEDGSHTEAITIMR